MLTWLRKSSHIELTGYFVTRV